MAATRATFLGLLSGVEVTDGGHGGPVQDLAHGRATAPGAARAASLSTFLVQGRDTDRCSMRSFGLVV